MNLFEEFQNSFSEEQEVEISLMDYLSLCKKEPLAYATAAERVLSAIGKPKIIDTSKDDRLSRIYMNRTIKVYPAFEQFYGMEEVIERIVGYFVHAAQGLEEKKQILYLLGPVGAAKSSLAEKIKSLVEYHPIYVLKAGDELSPVFETPLGIFDPNKKIGQKIINDFNIPERYLTNLPSPWAVKRLQEFNGDISKFSVVKVYPNKLKQIGIAKTEPGDENNQDISCLVGKVDIRKLEHFSQNDPDAYSYSGALCRGNQGIMEFVEMFKCVEKGTKIALADGTLKNIEDIIVGDTVLAVDEQTLKKTTDIVSKVWETERKEVYQLVTKRGLQLRAAGTHPVLTNHGWKQLQHITKDDFVADSDVYWDAVADINNTGDHAEMYDIQIQKNHNYIANGIVTHNSPIKVLHPLLTATQEGNYTGTEAIGGIPFAGIVLAHSNEAEWQTFRNNKSNEAFLDRICMIKVPYCLKITEEQMIYQKLLQHSSLGNSPCAPKTLEVLSQFCVLTRLKEHENSNLWSKMRVYNGENIKDTDPRAKTIVEYKEGGGVDEGMNGISTRFAFKILSQTFNFDNNEVAADPVHLMYVLEQAIKREQFPEEIENKYLEYIKEFIAPKYVEFLEKELQKTYLESYDEYGQNIFDRYCAYADAWISDADYKDQDTGQMLNRELINKELEKIEKPSGISNPKDFRHEFVNYVLRARGKKENAGENPRWTDYEKFRYVIEKKIFSSTEELLPIISFGSKKSSDDMEKHEEFVSRMIKQGYTRAQCRRLVEYYIRQSKSH
jgi:predicted Ser/Thr protein kinase